MELTVIQLGNVLPTKTRDNPNQGRVSAPEGVATSLNCMEGGGREPHIPIQIEAHYPSGNQKNAIFGIGGVARTLTATDYKQPCSVLVPMPSEIQPLLGQG